MDLFSKKSHKLDKIGIQHILLDSLRIVVIKVLLLCGYH